MSKNKWKDVILLTREQLVEEVRYLRELNNGLDFTCDKLEQKNQQLKEQLESYIDECKSGLKPIEYEKVITKLESILSGDKNVKYKENQNEN